jgi:hypothetical protein
MQRKGSYARCLREFYDEELWLTIEVLCFWLYFVAIVLYIFKMQMVGWCCQKKGKNDLAKQLMDFLEYSKHQMNFATILFVQSMATGAIIVWMKMSI